MEAYTVRRNVEGAHEVLESAAVLAPDRLSCKQR
jgi:hypothetical protein